MGVDEAFTNHPALGAGDISATHWSVVLAAGRSDSVQRTAALERLCGTYWYPLYAYARRQGNQPADSEDLTQAFFSVFLEKNYIAGADRARGRFRTFLLSSFKNFVINEWARARTVRRGSGQPILSLDAQSPEDRYALEPAEATTPDRVFEKNWAVATLEKVFARMRDEYAAAGKRVLYDNLKLLLWEEKGGQTYAELAARLGITEAAVKMAVVRLRRRCREALRMEVAQTVASADEVDEELRHLISSLRA